jgi:hypothetical protein
MVLHSFRDSQVIRGWAERPALEGEAYGSVPNAGHSPMHSAALPSVGLVWYRRDEGYNPLARWQLGRIRKGKVLLLPP